MSPSTDTVTRATVQPQPVSSTPVSVTVPRNTMVSPGKIEPFIRNVTRCRRPNGRGQLVM